MIIEEGHYLFLVINISCSLFRLQLIQDINTLNEDNIKSLQKYGKMDYKRNFNRISMDVNKITLFLKISCIRQNNFIHI